MLDNQDLINLSEKQRQLDHYIYENHRLSINSELIEKKMMAFLVELGEYANEERSFKYWSKKPQSPKERQLDEYIDGLHFLLSLGNDFDYDFNEFQFLAPKATSMIDQYFDIVYHFSDLLALIKATNLKKSSQKKVYAHLLNSYFGLANLAHYQSRELLAAYQQKNEINFSRQDQQY